MSTPDLWNGRKLNFDCVKTHAQSLSLSLPHTQTHTHTRTRTHSPAHSLYISSPRRLSIYLPSKHIYSVSCSSSFTTTTISLSLSLSLTHAIPPCTHSHSLAPRSTPKGEKIDGNANFLLFCGSKIRLSSSRVGLFQFGGSPSIHLIRDRHRRRRRRRRRQGSDERFSTSHLFMPRISSQVHCSLNFTFV